MRKMELKKILIIYFSIYLLVLLSMNFFKYYNQNNANAQERIISPEGQFSPSGSGDDGVLIEENKVLRIGKTPYKIVYENDTQRYLVYRNFNFYLGYIVLEPDETIDKINESNIFDRLTYEY